MEKKDLHIKFAKALHKLAQKQNKTAEFFEQLRELEMVFSDKEVYQMLALVAGMEISRVEEVVKAAFGKFLDDGVLNMLVLIVANRQLKLVSAIRKAYQRFYFEAAGITDFVIASSRELADQEK
ncbi:F0F1 ATP synthase subunit delta, partial [Candidatus Peregrinibacteria bacterium]|nr:F0F1 ATP synthase subunit delta [Candidatus Peregrinibacteria bacterium]